MRLLPFPLAVVVPLLCLFELAAHASLLRLPYYWDEAGYYIPAAYDFFRSGTVIPYSTLTNAHPPVLSFYLAAWWALFHFAPMITRIAMCVAASAALAAVFALTQQLLKNRVAAVAVTLLTAVYPVFFAQSSLAQADTLAAVFTLWGLFAVLAAPGGPGEDAPSAPRHLQRDIAVCALFTAAALTKEIAIGTPVALAAYEAVRGRGPLRAHLGSIAALCAPVIPLACWFAYHRWRTGFAFGNPEYVAYNAAGTLSVPRFALALLHRAMHLTLHLNLFVPVLVAVASFLLPPIESRQRLARGALERIWTVLVANALLFSLLGGALLTRYLLPMYPLVLLLAVAAVYRRFRQWLWFPALATVAFLAGLLLPPLYRVAPEDTLMYRDSVVLEQEAIAVVQSRYPASTVLSAWPVTDGLRKPELGYLTKPMPVVSIDNFSPQQVSALAQHAEPYSTAIVFSTKYEPRGLPSMLGRWGEHQEERWFGLHHDLSATQVAQALGGVVVWQAHRGQQWAAVLRFAHPQLARLSETRQRADADTGRGADRPVARQRSL